MGDPLYIWEPTLSYQVTAFETKLFNTPVLSYLPQLDLYLTNAQILYHLPRRTILATKVAVISANTTTALFLTTNGKVFGLGTPTDSGLFLGLSKCIEPQEIPELSQLSLKNISIGAAHAAGVSSQGRLFTWGTLNGDQKKVQPALEQFFIGQVACGPTFTCACTVGGHVYMLGCFHRFSTDQYISSGLYVKEVVCTSNYIAFHTAQGKVYVFEACSQLLQLPSNEVIDRLCAFEKTLIGVGRELHEWILGTNGSWTRYLYSLTGKLNIVPGGPGPALQGNFALDLVDVQPVICTGQLEQYRYRWAEVLQIVDRLELRQAFVLLKKRTRKSIPGFAAYKLVISIKSLWFRTTHAAFKTLARLKTNWIVSLQGINKLSSVFSKRCCSMGFAALSLDFHPRNTYSGMISLYSCLLKAQRARYRHSLDCLLAFPSQSLINFTHAKTSVFSISTPQRVSNLISKPTPRKTLKQILPQQSSLELRKRYSLSLKQRSKQPAPQQQTQKKFFHPSINRKNLS